MEDQLIKRGGDGDPPEWIPPSYAGDPIEDDKEWKPPAYAGKPIEEPKKPGILSRVVDALKPAEKIHPGKSLIDRANESIANFVKEHPYIKRILTSQNPAAESFLPEIPKSFGAADTYHEGYARGLYNELLRPFTSAEGIAGLISGEEGLKSHETPKELSVRQPSREIPYRAGSSVQTPIESSVQKAELPIRRPKPLADEPSITESKWRASNPDEYADEPTRPVESRDFGYNENDNLGVRQPKRVLDEPSTRELPAKAVESEVSEAKLEQKPIAKFAFDWPEAGGKQYNIEGGEYDGSTVGEAKLKELGIDVPKEEVKASEKKPFINPFEKKVEAVAESQPKAEAEGWKAPSYAGEPIEEQGLSTENKPIEPESTSESPSLADKASAKLDDFAQAAIDRIKKRGTFSGGRLMAGLPADDLADLAIYGAAKIAKGTVRFADWSAEVISDFGDALKPYLAQIWKASQEYHNKMNMSSLTKAAASAYKPQESTPVQSGVKKLFNSLIEAKGQNLEQQGINKAERAQRFQDFENTGGEGVTRSRKAMSKLAGEYDKAEPGEKLGLSKQETKELHNAIWDAKINTPEKARAITALNKLMKGDETLQQNELELLDRIFGKHMSKVSGPGASGGFDINSPESKQALKSFEQQNPKATNEQRVRFVDGLRAEAEEPTSFVEAAEKGRPKTPDNFLTKLANFSTKTTRTVLGFHVPGTALSFHGFNEAIRNTMFGPNMNPISAAGRFADAAHYLIRPGKAQEFLNLNAEELGKAIEEGGLRAATGDIGIAPMFKGDNLITKGINAISNPKLLFGQVIPALKLKAYNGLVAQYEKGGMPHAQAAKAAGEAANNIFGGLNLQQLERDPNTQKLFRIAALAPDWLESNVRLGKGMFDAIRHPSSPQNKVYMTGMVNFLGSYVGLNILNAINNDGKFSFQNDVGHEFDIAIGKDSAGRVRYISPYGTAMDMFRIPLEIGHAAVDGNMGRAFSDMRSRASEPLQFMTDMMTNTDYARRSLYDKTQFGKPIPPVTQGVNIAGDAAGHFLPIGLKSGVDFSQDKISPEEFASQVLQMPMKYKFPDQPQSSLKLRNMKLK